MLLQTLPVMLGFQDEMVLDVVLALIMVVVVTDLPEEIDVNYD
jgi:hypothetical protein